MGLFNKKPSIPMPKNGQVVWVYQAEAEKIRPFLVINKYKACGNWKLTGVYITTQYNEHHIQIDSDSSADTRRIIELSHLSVKTLDVIVSFDIYKSVIGKVKSNFNLKKYKK